ncbi:MAG: hypothetical protein QGH51_02050 [Planctomycetota bacterium]|jgi:hypothetical protein|nr:hypothetical protein [Planctomycetota bacterium]MDP6940784.1 hypothetical protein [Planctomycetota bacterium]
MLCTSLLFFAPIFPPQEVEANAIRGRTVAYRLDHIETLDGDSISNGTIVVRGGVIQKIGQAIVIPEGAEVRDFRGSDSTAMPPLVVSSTSFPQSATNGSRSNFAQYRAVDSLWLEDEFWSDLLEQGVTMLGVAPKGSYIPGRTSVLDSSSGAEAPTAVVDDLHLVMTISLSSSAKRTLRDAIKAGEKAIEDEKKAKADWEAARKAWDEQQKAKAEAAKKAEKEKAAGETNGKPAPQKSDPPKKEKGKEQKEPPKEFVPPAIAPPIQPIVEWLQKERLVQVWMSEPADWLHWEDVLGDRELPWEAVLSVGSRTNFHKIVPRMAESGVRIHVPTSVSFIPDTRIRVNVAAELAAAGANLVFLPSSDRSGSINSWRLQLSKMIQSGMDRELILKGITLKPAESMGQEERVQALKVGAPANFVIFGGDPLDPVSEVELVVEDGKSIWDREKEEEK